MRPLLFHVLFLAFVTVAAAAPVQHSILDYGAAAAANNNAAAIQRAIDKVAESGGGTVIVPAGRFLTGPLRMRSRITLQLTTTSRRRRRWASQRSHRFRCRTTSRRSHSRASLARHVAWPLIRRVPGVRLDRYLQRFRVHPHPIHFQRARELRRLVRRTRPTAAHRQIHQNVHLGGRDRFL
jgi:hypothetical protein